MYVKINNVKYKKLKNLSFVPETDLSGQSIPICEYSVSIITDDDIAIGEIARLYDDLDTLWASYVVVYAERHEDDMLHIRAQSDLIYLDQDRLPAVYYNAEPIANVLEDVFANTGSGMGAYVYRLDSSFSSATVTGACPEQNARERLLWVCFTLGAYVKQYFSDYIDILPIPSQAVTVPLDMTYWKPKPAYRDLVTEIRCKYYTFAVSAEPGPTDKYIVIGSTYYVITEAEATLANPAAPAGAPASIVSIDGVYLLNSANVGTVLSFLARWHFSRTTVDMAVIDNAEFIPGQKAIIYMDEASMATGYIESCDFSFGMQAKADMRLTATSEVEAATLTILYKYGNLQLDRKQFTLPVGTTYTIPNPYIDMVMSFHRYIFRPLAAAATGTIASGANASTQSYAVALDLINGVLHIVSVDGVTVDTNDIGVIS